MEQMIETTKKKALIDIVRLVQKRGLKGKLGDWKQFLNSYDKKFGSNLSDPSKRSHEVLAAFLNTFHEQEHLKFLYNIMQQHSNKEILGQLKDKSHDSPEQRLVQETLQNPAYPLDYSFKPLNEVWEVINLKDMNKAIKYTSMVAVDCEMVRCVDGTEALVEVCVVDRNLKVKLHERLRPNKAIADYRTDITGVSSQDLEGVTCSLADIQESMKKLLSDGTILVGHGLYNDLRVLKLDHVKVIDTSYIFQNLDGPIHRRPSLSSLCKAVLGDDVREKGATHSCLDDACAAMKLVLAKIELGVDRVIPLIEEPIPESEIAKLLLHGIPTSVKSEELHSVLPGDFTIQLKNSKKGRGEKYSAFAIFKNPREALQAYENVQGSQEKDTAQRPQKLVKFKLGTGKTASLYVRKMAPDGHDQIPPKRALEVNNDAFDVSKKAKMGPNSNDTYIDALKKEIEALNQQLKEKDMLIELLQKQLKQNDFGISKLHNKMVLPKKERE
ncbi:PREDICTED: small RNA degrading nuclease 1-like [Lupinus angustifolius]|uniref:small RNA degrading nuclease 1-like n=1 Tax=Lupinus angustifolius TaxID=3871 RepID=UPI00092FC1BB|nr:PREDICTED: small RNA degrading nuclease 1-like [Lupinus angustifolius]